MDGEDGVVEPEGFEEDLINDDVLEESWGVDVDLIDDDDDEGEETSPGVPPMKTRLSPVVT